MRDVKTFPNLSGPDQKIKWSAIKQNFSHLKNLDLKDTGPVRLIIGSNNSDLMKDSLILTEYHMQSRHLSVGQSLTGYPVKKKVASPYNAFKVYETSAGEEEELQRLLTAQSEVESLGVVKLADPVRSIEDRRELAVMEPRTEKLEATKTHGFLITTTWLSGDESLEKKFKNDPEIKERYAKSIQDDIE